jgi:hypothetical protein
MAAFLLDEQAMFYFLSKKKLEGSNERTNFPGQHVANAPEERKDLSTVEAFKAELQSRVRQIKDVGMKDVADMLEGVETE